MFNIVAKWCRKECAKGRIHIKISVKRVWTIVKDLVPCHLQFHWQICICISQIKTWLVCVIVCGADFFHSFLRIALRLGIQYYLISIHTFCVTQFTVCRVMCPFKYTCGDGCVSLWSECPPQFYMGCSESWYTLMPLHFDIPSTLLLQLCSRSAELCDLGHRLVLMAIKAVFWASYLSILHGLQWNLE